MKPGFETTFDAGNGAPVSVAGNVLRICAPNASPFTFKGTNSYLVGTERLVLIDPGPEDDSHFDAILAAAAGRSIEAILVTHTHLDHTGLVPRLRAATGATVFAQGPHRASRPLHEGETNMLEAGGDRAFQPDRMLADGERVEFGAGRFEAVATPGHTANHLCFALENSGLLFSGDHVMAWSTTIVAPPDGSLTSYMQSLEKLMGRREERYLPGHGGPVDNPLPFLRALRSHRRMREAAILDCVAAGTRTIPEIVATVYRTTDPRLHGAAALSVLAHLEALAARGAVRVEGPPLIGSRYEAA